MMNEQSRCQSGSHRIDRFWADLKQWLTIMRAYENGGHAYHATMPTDGLTKFRDTVKEAEAIGLDKLKSAQFELGEKYYPS